MNLESSKTKFIEVYIGDKTFKPIQNPTLNETIIRLKDKELFMLINDTLFFNDFKNEFNNTIIKENIYPYLACIYIVCFIHTNQITDTIGIDSFGSIQYKENIYKSNNFGIYSLLLDKIPLVYHTAYQAQKMFYMNSPRRIK